MKHKGLNYVFNVDLQITLVEKHYVHLSGITKDGIMYKKECIKIPSISQLILNFENVNPYYSLFDKDRNGYLVYDIPEFNCDQHRMLTAGNNIKYHTLEYLESDGPTSEVNLFINQKLNHTDHTGMYLQINAEKHPVNHVSLTEVLESIKESDRWHIKAPSDSSQEWESTAIEFRKTREEALRFETLFYQKLNRQFHDTKAFNSENMYPYWDNELDIFMFRPNDRMNSAIGKDFETEQIFADFLIDKVFRKDLYHDLKGKKMKQIVNPSIDPNFQANQINRRFSSDNLKKYVFVSEICRVDEDDVKYMVAAVTIKRDENEYFSEQTIVEIWVIPVSFLTQNLIY